MSVRDPWIRIPVAAASVGGAVWDSCLINPALRDNRDRGPGLHITTDLEIRHKGR